MIGFDFQKYPTLASASASPALFKAVIGPAGSAKTSWAFVEMFRRACLQAPGSDGGRYFKLVVIRNTYQVLTSATLDTARRVLGELVDFRESTPPNGKARFPLDDGTFVDFKVEFLSMDSEDAQRKLLGFEPTGVILDEISELPVSLVHAVIRRLGRYPSGNLGQPTWTGAIGVTNGPREDHWLYEWSKSFKAKDADLISRIEEEMGRPYFHLFQQPPALLRPTRSGETWQPNPKAENIHNLEGGYGYYYAMLADADDAKIKSYVEGDFAPLITGKRVFTDFAPRHVLAASEFRLPMHASIGLAFDFGRTPVCVVWTEMASGRMVFIDAFAGEDMAVDTLLQDSVLPALRSTYAQNTVEWCTGDPAGSVGAQSVELSPYDVVLNAGLPITPPAPTNRLEPRLEAVRQYLRRLDTYGNPMLQVVEANQDAGEGRGTGLILDSLGRDYVYEKVNAWTDRVRDTPTKSHVNWVSDVADAVQYACQLRANSLRTTGTRTRNLPPRRAGWGL